MKHLTLFETTAAYNAAILDLPNVSLVEETMGVSFNPYVPETRVVCKYNVTSTSEPTALRTNYEQNIFKSMEIDGVMLDELVTEYTFGTTGEHIVKYELYNETKLGNNAPVFYNSNLIECIIPNTVTSIGDNAFMYCRGLTNITIPDSVTSIGGGAFGGCSDLTNIDIPDSVTSIGNQAFDGCGGLTSITIPDSVTSIGSAILSGTESLKVLNYNAKCDLSNNIRNNASWLNLETVIIGDSTPTISNGAFADCSGLTSVTIGSGITNIGYGIFTNCSSLTNITSLATTAPTIQSTTFKDVKTGGTLTVPNGSTGYDAWMSANDYYLGKYNWTIVYETYNGFCKLTLNDGSTVELQGSGELTSSMISPYSYDIANAEIGKLCTSIGSDAFSMCQGLTSITIGNSVTSIGNNAFYSTKLTSIVIPDSVTSIGQEAFSWCTKLTSITSNATTAPTIQSNTFNKVETGGILTVPSGSTGYDVWMGTGDYYLGKYNWTKVEQ